MSRFPDLAALKKLVAASALETKKKKHETQSPLCSPPPPALAQLFTQLQRTELNTPGRKGRKVTVGQAEVPQITQEKEGWELDVK